jgi:hypothetical protein
MPIFLMTRLGGLVGPFGARRDWPWPQPGPRSLDLGSRQERICRLRPQLNTRRINSYLIFAPKKPMAGPAVNGTRRENGGCRPPSTHAVSALTAGELSAMVAGRPEFACDDHPEHFAQLCGTLWTESGFKSRLGLGPSLMRHLQALLTCLGQVEFLCALVGCRRFDPNETVALQAPVSLHDEVAPAE